MGRDVQQTAETVGEYKQPTSQKDRSPPAILNCRPEAVAQRLCQRVPRLVGGVYVDDAGDEPLNDVVVVENSTVFPAPANERSTSTITADRM